MIICNSIGSARIPAENTETYMWQKSPDPLPHARYWKWSALGLVGSGNKTTSNENWSTISLPKHQFTWLSERWLNVFSALGCFWCTAIAKWTSCESSILADHNTANTLSLSKERHFESWCVNEIWSYMYSCRDCAIVISIKRAFKWCPKVIFDGGHIFAKKIALKQRIIHGFHNFGSKSNLQQNGHHLKALFMLITMVQISASYLIPSPRYIS